MTGEPCLTEDVTQDVALAVRFDKICVKVGGMFFQSKNAMSSSLHAPSSTSVLQMH